MKNAVDLTGAKFHRWTVVGGYQRIDKQSYWLCRCECGTEKIVASGSLKNGSSKSCGCYRSETVKNKETTHGLSKSPEWNTWSNIKQRCYNQNNERYREYGGRGIKVCERWLESFENFYEDMGNRPEGMTIERIDADGDYCPENCRWATWHEQRRNKQDTDMIEFDGKIMCLSDWAAYVGISQPLLWKRIHSLGWNVEKALTTPPRSIGPKKSRPSLEV